MSNKKINVYRRIPINNMPINTLLNTINSVIYKAKDGYIESEQCCCKYYDCSREVYFVYNDIETDEEYNSRMDKIKQKNKEKRRLKKLERQQNNETDNIETAEREELKRLLNKYGSN